MGSNEQGATSHINNRRKCIQKGGECTGRSGATEEGGRSWLVHLRKWKMASLPRTWPWQSKGRFKQWGFLWTMLGSVTKTVLLLRASTSHSRVYVEGRGGDWIYGVYVCQCVFVCACTCVSMPAEVRSRQTSGTLLVSASLPSSKITNTCATTPRFSHGLWGEQTQVSMLTWYALYLLSQLSNQEINI